MSKALESCLGFEAWGLWSRVSGAVTENSGLFNGGAMEVRVGCFLKADAADKAVLWNSIVLGVELPS